MASNVDVPEGSDLLKSSTLYREFQAEREEILRHKWLESEKVGYDIGFERALTDWIIKHRAKWRKSRQAKQRSEPKEDERDQETNAPPENCEHKENH